MAGFVAPAAPDRRHRPTHRSALPVSLGRHRLRQCRPCHALLCTADRTVVFFDVMDTILRRLYRRQAPAHLGGVGERRRGRIAVGAALLPAGVRTATAPGTAVSLRWRRLPPVPAAAVRLCGCGHGGAVGRTASTTTPGAAPFLQLPAVLPPDRAATAAVALLALDCHQLRDRPAQTGARGVLGCGAAGALPA
eukprot:ctg_410.g214